MDNEVHPFHKDTPPEAPPEPMRYVIVFIIAANLLLIGICLLSWLKHQHIN